VTDGRDFSVLGLIKHADPVVQATMILLALCSIACWALIFEKLVRLRRLHGEVGGLESLVAEPSWLTNASAGLAGVLSTAASAETAGGLAKGETRTDLRERLERAMRGAARAELKRLEIGLPFLATVGAASPFVGLFGTVWGIMHSFTSIAQAKDTSLAVVAPGIAEALFATALGLAVAVPAVVAYNQITVALGRSTDRIGGLVAVLSKRLAYSCQEQP
jgi:biopolymer transport protein ExbB/TolQ